MTSKRPGGLALYGRGSTAGGSSGVTAGERALSGVLEELEELVGWLGRLYGVSLPLPTFPSLASLKGFLAEPLAPGSTHPWVRLVAPLKLRDRLSILGSLFLFRKRVPVLDPPSLSAYVEKMGTPSSAPADGFIRFCSSELDRMFPHGWDRGWRGRVLSTTLSPSSCLESRRSKGGNLGVLAREEWLSRQQFCENLLDKYSSWRPNTSRVRVTHACEDGKTRIVSANSVDANCLRPYHELLYARISGFDWCLRGEATTAKFSGFVQKDGEVFVSGDYESATDNLNQEVASHILGFVGRRCSRVPLFVREAASRTLRCDLVLNGTSTRQRRGQLMGNFMSFPLLCLQNYLAFRFHVRRDVPVRINGDDIVFRSTEQEYDSWSRGVQQCGLTLSKGKTAVARNWFSLNSTFFRAGRKAVHLAPVIRSTAFFRKVDDPLSLTGRWNTLKCFGGEARWFLQCQFLKRFSALIWRSQRSLRRGWGWNISENVLKRSGLFKRECFYSSLPSSRDCPIPGASVGYFKTSIPEGWHKVWSSTGRDDPDFGPELVANCWKPEVCRSPPVVDWRRLTLVYVSSPVSRRRARLLGSNLKGLRTFLRGSQVLLDTRRRKGGWVWRRECEGVVFVRG
nr:MAG: putative RNA-dependent RNA polymerase [Magoulivirus sp.]